MSNQCYIIQVDNNLEVFNMGSEKKMLDRVVRHLSDKLSAASKEVAGRIMEKDLRDFTGSLKGYTMRGDLGGSVGIYLGSSSETFLDTTSGKAK